MAYVLLMIHIYKSQYTPADFSEHTSIFTTTSTIRYTLFLFSAILSRVAVVENTDSQAVIAL